MCRFQSLAPVAAFVLCLSSVVAVLSSPGSSNAEPIGFSFSGAVVATNKPGTFPIGQSVDGYYVFESTTPDMNPFNAEQGAYGGALIVFAFETGPYAALADESNSANDGGDILVNRNDIFNPHQYEVFTSRDVYYLERWGADVDGEQLIRMRVLLVDANQMAITSIALPLTPPDLSLFTSKEFGLFFESDPTSDPGVVFALDMLVIDPTTGIRRTTWGRVKRLYQD